MKPIIKQTLAFLVMLMATIQTFGYDFKLDGIYYNITSKEDRTVEVTYYSYVGSDNKYAYDGAISIPQKLIYSNKTYTVTAIGERAFVRCYLTSIDIPNSVTSIGQYAFYGCGSLTSIDIPNSVTSIGRYAFYDCSSLTSIDIPNPVPSIGDYAFYGCSSLTSIDIPNSVTSIGDYAFYDCSSLTSIDIPNSVTSIGRYAFVYCSSLTSIDIPNSVTSIDNSTFSNCPGLTSIDIPNSVTSIGYSAFQDSSGLTSIDIPNSVTSIGWYAFSGCTGLTSAKIGSSLKILSPGWLLSTVFDDCKALMSISVSEDNENYSSIDGVLYNKDASELLIYPEGRSSETSISLPATLKSIGKYELTKFPELTSIYLHSETPPTYNSVFSADILKNTILYIPKGSLAAYEKVTPWRNFLNIEEMEYSGIDDIEAGDAISITVVDGSIIINGIDGAIVNVYDISGKLMYSGNGNVVDGLNRGMYIVRIGNIARKVVI